MMPALAEPSGRIGNTDAAGQVGRRVAARLASRGIKQRLVARDGAAAPSLPGTEVVVLGGNDDGTGLQHALAGVDTLFLVPVREDPSRVARHRTAVDAAMAAGVRRIVYLSFLGAAPTATFTLARDHYATEQYIRATGLEFTFLRGSAFMDVLRWIVGGDGVIRGPAGSGRFAPVCRDDVADVAAALLTSAGHDEDIVDVTGPRTLSMYEVAEAFSRASGRTVTYVEESAEQARASRARYGAPDWQLDAWVSTYLQIARGELDVVSDAVPRLTGHPARTLSEFLAGHPDSYEHLTPHAASNDRFDSPGS
jgi:uncharacterized protein YbjT (DUF2867 family)